ncbi:hypothetical protein GCM10010420_36250 [Streptomyces glaucosporus]|uniref:Uncharacterized protein n=1 Tax=Streptomyces glaucosporus TaxID=284044 RepID=A0ABN3IJL7_9ACTN
MRGPETGPAGLVLPGAAGMRLPASVPSGEVGSELDTEQVTVTAPALKVALPVSLAAK